MTRHGQRISGVAVKTIPAEVLGGEHSIRPAYLDWTQEQKDRAALPTLRAAYLLLGTGGWVRPYSRRELGNAPTPIGFSLIEALARAGGGFDGLAYWWARVVVQRVLASLGGGMLLGWEDCPGITREDVLSLLARAIRSVGGVPPSLPFKPLVLNRGGRHVSSGGAA